MKKFTGIISAMITPLDKNGAIYEQGIKELCDFLINKGVDALYPGGSTGECPLLSVEDRKKLAELTIKHADGRVPVVVHTGTNLPQETLELTKHAKQIGADGAAMIPPYYYGYDEQCLLDYFGTMAQAVPEFPLYLYNIPVNAKNDLVPSFVKKLAGRHPEFVGIKFTSDSFLGFLDYVETMGEDFCVLMGNDSLILPGLVMGAHGGVTANSTVFPEPFVDVYKYYRQGNLQKAKEAQRFASRIRKVFRSNAPYLTVYKTALKWRGIDVGGTRRPLREMTAEEEKSLKAALNNLGLLK
jgi:Dihydrodipicolinate synthase/N-acetylneuraminate lyase